MKLYISDFTGLCNRLEALAFAYVIRDYFGHEIALDWPELDFLRIPGTRRGSAGLDRWRAPKLRDCDPDFFETLGARPRIILRGMSGAPAPALARAARRVAADLRLHPRLGRQIRELFAPARAAGRPVAGVHLRRGDYRQVDSDVHDLSQNRYTAVPDWWFRSAMERVRERHPGILFFVSGTGEPRSQPWLREFDCLFLQEASPFAYKGPSHASAVNPVADLFALGCCPLLLATPASSFSHWAAHLLGPAAAILMPPPRTTRADPALVTLARPADSLTSWLAASRTGAGTVPVDPARNLPPPGLPETDWL